VEKVDSSERAEFIGAYTRVLSSAWSDEDYAHRLTSNPADALREQGLEVPAGANVVVSRHIPSNVGEPSIDTAIIRWEEGETTGTYVLSVPEEPQLNTTELSEEELASVAAGEVTISYCCCTPCCSCA
jgi:hypothetical protein